MSASASGLPSPLPFPKRGGSGGSGSPARGGAFSLGSRLLKCRGNAVTRVFCDWVGGLVPLKSHVVGPHVARRCPLQSGCMAVRGVVLSSLKRRRGVVPWQASHRKAKGVSAGVPVMSSLVFREPCFIPTLDLSSGKVTR